MPAEKTVAAANSEQTEAHLINTQNQDQNGANLGQTDNSKDQVAAKEAEVSKDSKDSQLPSTERSTEQPTADQENNEEDDPEAEVTTGNWKLPQVEVKEVEVKLGEESEEEIWKHRAMLYRWSNGEWKQRGLGDAKLLKDDETKIRFLLRQEKTGKIVANHYVVPDGDMCKLTPNAGNDKIWVWSVLDCAEEPHTVEQFGLRFGTPEAALGFKEAFEKAAEENKKLFDQGKF